MIEELTDRRVEAHRAWRVLLEMVPAGDWEPMLVGALSRIRWPAASQSAECDVRLRRGVAHPPWDAPRIECSCGIYGAMDAEQARLWGFARWPAVSARGPVQLSGRVFRSAEEYRAASARIVGPLALRIGCTVTNCVAIGEFVVTGPHPPWPFCTRHVLEHSKGATGISLTAEFAPTLGARLEARYGVPVATSLEGSGA